MGRRYYCEYCEKAFADNATNRRNHLNGVQHRTMRKLHYDSFQDPEIVLADDANKRPCRQFLQGGECKFASACKYSHLKPEDREQLKALVTAQQEAMKLKRDAIVLEDGSKIIADWLGKRKKVSNEVVGVEATGAPGNIRDCETDRGTVHHLFSLPSVLNGFSNLPISLLPPDPQTLLEDGLEQWG